MSSHTVTKKMAQNREVETPNDKTGIDRNTLEAQIDEKIKTSINVIKQANDEAYLNHQNELKKGLEDEIDKEAEDILQEVTEKIHGINAQLNKLTTKQTELIKKINNHASVTNIKAMETCCDAIESSTNAQLTEIEKQLDTQKYGPPKHTNNKPTK